MYLFELVALPYFLKVKLSNLKCFTFFGQLSKPFDKRNEVILKPGFFGDAYCSVGGNNVETLGPIDLKY